MLIKPCDSIIEFLPVPKSGTHHFAVIMTVVRVGEEEQESESLSLSFFFLMLHSTRSGKKTSLQKQIRVSERDAE